ncbi:hypothetical protein [Fibrobacter sp. UBA4309]|uniref:hypothetical protein n=1 Tax=Fibrobacter sp. UBA4309 TaxID=1946537 RepID=UPI0025BF5A1B|nr:hypothetical protein [Fibrobacter sp. UBA4309]
MAKTINEAFSEFMQNSVDLDPKDVVTARYSRDNLLENIGELDCRGFFRFYPDVNIQFGSFARKTKKRPLDHVSEKSNFGGLNGGLSGGLSGGLKIELNETQQKVFLEITKRPGVMIKELSGRLQMPIDTLDKVVSSLRKKELIERRGSKKTGGYWVKKEPTSTGW